MNHFDEGRALQSSSREHPRSHVLEERFFLAAVHDEDVEGVWRGGRGAGRRSCVQGREEEEEEEQRGGHDLDDE